MALVYVVQEPSAYASKDDPPRTDFALGYDWLDMCDEGERSLIYSTLLNATLTSSRLTCIPLPDYPFTPLCRICSNHNLLFLILQLRSCWTLDGVHPWLACIERLVQRDGAREFKAAMYLRFILVVVSSVLTRLLISRKVPLRPYTKSSTEPLPTMSSALRSTILLFDPGTFTHNTAGVPIFVACTKAYLIDDNTDLIGVARPGCVV